MKGIPVLLFLLLGCSSSDHPIVDAGKSDAPSCMEACEPYCRGFCSGDRCDVGCHDNCQAICRTLEPDGGVF